MYIHASVTLLPTLSSTQVVTFLVSLGVETYLPIKAHPGGMESVQAPLSTLTDVSDWLNN